MGYIKKVLIGLISSSFVYFAISTFTDLSFIISFFLAAVIFIITIVIPDKSLPISHSGAGVSGKTEQNTYDKRMQELKAERDFERGQEAEKEQFNNWFPESPLTKGLKKVPKTEKPWKPTRKYFK